MLRLSGPVFVPTIMEYGDGDNEKRSSESNRLVKETNMSHSESDDFEFRPSQSWIYSQKTTAESLDFEETESVMWRKVRILGALFIL